MVRCHQLLPRVLRRMNLQVAPVPTGFHLLPVAPNPFQEQIFLHSFSFTTSQFFHQKKMNTRGVKRQRDFNPPHEHKKAKSMPKEGKDDVTNRISRYIWAHCHSDVQLQSITEKKVKLRDAIYSIIKGVFPYCGLYIVGSSMNGFGSINSDMDMCIMLSHKEIDQKKDALEILRMIQGSLRHCKFLNRVLLIRAKVPILRFTDRISNVECDVNINNSVGIRNTHLLHAYSQMDSRIVPLVQTVKRWAKSQNINDASQGTISSYSLCLMVLHYLQCGCTPSVIPSLQQRYPHKFDAEQDIRRITLNDELPEYKSRNEQSIGELFLGFLEYYALKFNFEDDCISVRMASVIPIQDVRKQTTNINQWKCLCIEEPFDLSNTARSVFDPNLFQHIQRVFRKAHLHLKHTGDMHSLFATPF